jgi:ABC-type multidrug transport system ATPase subunit
MGLIMDGLSFHCFIVVEDMGVLFKVVSCLGPGEMIVGPTQALFMDEISTGLDSSTTFSIVNSLRQSAKILEYTILVSLLQPAPETFNLFDDIILLSEGQVVYHGPRDQVLAFFESCGFRCPDRKGIADFLQEVKNFSLRASIHYYT